MSSPSFRTIKEIEIETVDRTLARQQISQFSEISGDSKGIVIKDPDTNKTFVTLDKNGIVLNDGSNNRLRLGKKI